MFRRMIIIFLWAVGVFCASQMVLAFVSGFVFYGLAIAYGDSATGDTIAKWVVRVFLVLSVGLTVATIVLGVKQRLPGTRAPIHGDAG